MHVQRLKPYHDRPDNDYADNDYMSLREGKVSEEVSWGFDDTFLSHESNLSEIQEHAASQIAPEPEERELLLRRLTRTRRPSNRF